MLGTGLDTGARDIHLTALYHAYRAVGCMAHRAHACICMPYFATQDRIWTTSGILRGMNWANDAPLRPKQSTASEDDLIDQLAARQPAANVRSA